MLAIVIRKCIDRDTHELCLGNRLVQAAATQVIFAIGEQNEHGTMRLVVDREEGVIASPV